MFSLAVYWGNCLLSILIAKLGTMINREKTTVLAIVSALPIFIITSIRYDVGSDYFSYRSIYELMQYGDSGRYEWLFYLMNRFVGFFDADPQWIFVVSAAIFLYCSFKRLWTDSPNPGLSIFLLMGSMIYFTYLNGMRQLLGCSICFYAMEYAYKRRPLPFFLLVFLASGFHQICVLFSIAYFLNWIKFDLKKALVAIAGTYVFSQTIFKFVINILADTSYGNYMLNDIDNLVTFIPINIAVWLFCVVFYNKNNPRYRLYLNCQFVMVLLSLFYWQIPLIARVMWTFWLPQIVLIPMALDGINPKVLRLFFGASIIILFFIYSSYSIAVNFSHNVVPYQTIWG